jgi:hypothetical protein
MSSIIAQAGILVSTADELPIAKCWRRWLATAKADGSFDRDAALSQLAAKLFVEAAKRASHAAGYDRTVETWHEYTSTIRRAAAIQWLDQFEMTQHRDRYAFDHLVPAKHQRNGKSRPVPNALLRLGLFEAAREQARRVASSRPLLTRDEAVDLERRRPALAHIPRVSLSDAAWSVVALADGADQEVGTTLQEPYRWAAIKRTGAVVAQSLLADPSVHGRASDLDVRSLQAAVVEDSGGYHDVELYDAEPPLAARWTDIVNEIGP